MMRPQQYSATIQKPGHTGKDHAIRGRCGSAAEFPHQVCPDTDPAQLAARRPGRGIFQSSISNYSVATRLGHRAMAHAEPVQKTCDLGELKQTIRNLFAIAA